MNSVNAQGETACTNKPYKIITRFKAEQMPHRMITLHVIEYLSKHEINTPVTGIENYKR